MSQEPSDLAKLARQMYEDSMRWFGDTPIIQDIPFHALALGGEVGELQNIIKKIMRGSLDIHDPHTRYQLAMEWTDSFIYLMLLSYLLKIDPEKSYQFIRARNEKRFMEERKVREANND